MSEDAKRRVKEEEDFQDMQRALREVDEGYAKGGKAKTYAKGGVTRADGCAQRGKTKGRMV